MRETDSRQPSDHFDGRQFFNPAIKGQERGLRDLVKWLRSRQAPVWTPRAVTPAKPPVDRAGPGECWVTFVNHATVLAQIDGLNILTDPIWSERASPARWAGPKRFHAPGVRLEDLPPLDAVLVSHSHFDHMDLPTLRRLRDLHRPRFYVGLGNRRYLNGRGLDDVVELDWWETAPLGETARVTFTPAQHWSSRGPADRHRSLWGGFVAAAPSGSIFFAGDTGYAAHFREIRERLGPPRLALLPIGAYEPRWFMSQMHIGPDEAVQAHLDLGAQTSLAIHYGTFLVSDEAQDQPPHDLRAALAAAGLPDEVFWTLGPGESRAVPAIDTDPIQSERESRRPDGGASAARSAG